jgi:hypothetical protein
MVKKKMTPTYASCKHIAFGYAKEGKPDKAFDWLEKVNTEFGYLLNPADLIGLKARVAGSHKKQVQLRSVSKNLKAISSNL